MNDDDTLAGHSIQLSTFEGLVGPGDNNSLDSQITGFGRQESKAVSVLKRFMICMLIVATAVASVMTWRFTSTQERDSFKEVYNGHGSQFMEIFTQNTGKRVAAASALSVTFTAFVANSTWPYVTMPNFQELCALPLHSAQANYISFAPIVRDRAAWEAYAVGAEASVDKELEGTFGLSHRHDDNIMDQSPPHDRTVWDGIYQMDEEGNYINDQSDGPYAPTWQISPHKGNAHWIMFNMFDGGLCQRAMETMIWTSGVVLSEIMVVDNKPRSLFFVPIFRDFSSSSSEHIVGTIILEIDWEVYFQESLHTHEEGVDVVLTNTCGQEFTFESTDNQLVYIGEGDLHDPRYDNMRITSDPKDLHYLCASVPFSSEYMNGYQQSSEEEQAPGAGSIPRCQFSISVYPTRSFETMYITTKPVGYTIFVILIFFFTSGIFIAYDCIVMRRQHKIVNTARQAKSIVDSLFPHQVRDRVFQSTEPNGMEISLAEEENTKKQKLKRILMAGTAPKDGVFGEPIADLFPHTTVMFADIAGFTAWSSEREPSQVFVLLETLYQKFDTIASRLGVFKVETIGDCYVAVTGLPESNKHHAVIMARFALECQMAMSELIKEMEVTLGPGTADLAMRFGLHSGPVTAGVLRGEKSRFQLFGDTMNTASRMESTSKPGWIQLSQETAQLVKEGGKDHWLTPRVGMVSVKGKGDMQTCWLKLRRKASVHQDQDNDHSSSEFLAPPRTSKLWGHLDIDVSVSSKYSLTDKDDRLIDWNVDVLLGCLAKVVSRRYEAQGRKRWVRPTPKEDSHNVMEEVTEIIVLPEFDGKAAKRNGDCSLTLPEAVKAQLRLFVFTIASLYMNENQFHNFEHASHVLMSATKLMNRIVAPDDFENNNITDKREKSKYVEELHHNTFGISSDPLAQFAIVFSALIHDVEHLGVPNNTLINEKSAIAERFNNKSVAEQNSVVVSWDLLMEDRFADLQNCIFSNDDERSRFRQLVVNCVMATDIMDRDLNTLRKNRWAKAFSGELSTNTMQDVNRKATVVMEHIIQASDVAHTMQHWHIYARWNQRLFDEMYTAFLNGRSEKDPCDGWYESEIWFFDNYIIPLAKKLKECGVFGVSSDEYLQYAIENRREWERKGKETSESMLSKFWQQNPEMKSTKGDVVLEVPDEEVPTEIL